MRKLHRIFMITAAVVALGLVGPTAAFASNVCPVIGGPNNPSIKGTPAIVPDKTGNPAHGGDPAAAQPGDAFWN
jgi:hypothetical protein